MTDKLVVHVNNIRAPKPNLPLLPGACAVILNKRGEILLHKRDDNGLWSLPGGQMKTGESISGCILREVKEETSLDIRIDKLIGLYTSPKVIFEFPNGAVLQSFVVAFLCSTNDTRVVINEESIDFRWVTRTDLLDLPTLPYVKEIVSTGLSAKEASFD